MYEPWALSATQARSQLSFGETIASSDKLVTTRAVFKGQQVLCVEIVPPRLDSTEAALSQQATYLANNSRLYSDLRRLMKLNSHCGLCKLVGCVWTEAFGTVVIQAVLLLEFCGSIAAAHAVPGIMHAPRILRDILEALVAVHEAGMTHGNVDGDHIFVDQNGGATLSSPLQVWHPSDKQPGIDGLKEFFAFVA